MLIHQVEQLAAVEENQQCTGVQDEEGEVVREVVQEVLREVLREGRGGRSQSTPLTVHGSQGTGPDKGQSRTEWLMFGNKKAPIHQEEEL